jgi:RNA polymerase sigma-70 factor, ECF subfamily
LDPVPEEGVDERSFRREQGDFDALFRAHYPEIVRYLTARLGSRDDASEVASEVFVEAWRRVPGLQWRGRPARAWLYRVAANMAADELKRRGRVAPLEDDAEAPDPTERVPDRVALVHALRELPPEYQLVVHLRLVEGQPFAEVARVMGKSVGACQMLLLRAGKLLRATLEREGVHEHA